MRQAILMHLSPCLVVLFILFTVSVFLGTTLDLLTFSPMLRNTVWASSFLPWAETMYIPFSHTPLVSTWVPFIENPSTEYNAFCHLVQRYVPKDVGGTEAEVGYRAVLNFVALYSPHRTSRALPPPGVWAPHMAHVVHLWRLATPFGLLLDDLFLELALPEPSQKPYYLLLAARGTLFMRWITRPRAHTPSGTTILITYVV